MTKCVYAQLCNYYQPLMEIYSEELGKYITVGITCNKEPSGYCGKFREFEEKYKKKNS